MPSPVPLVERKRRQARQRIIRAAEELFAEHGFDDVSVSDIAERAEVGRTTFFRHFGDKQEVVFAKQQELLDMIAAAGEAEDLPAPRSVTEAVEALRPLVLSLCTRAVEDPEGYRHHFELVDGNPELRARDAAKTQQIAQRIGDVLVQRGADPADAVLAGHAAIACYQTAKELGNDPATVVNETRNAFNRLLALGSSPNL